MRKASDNEVLHTWKIKKLGDDKVQFRKEDNLKQLSEAKIMVNRMLPEGYEDVCLRNVGPLKVLHQTFQAYYRAGHSPFSALVCHKCDLHSLYGPEFYNIVSSNFMCPPYNWCCHEYFKLFNKEFVCPRKEELEKTLKTMVEEYNKQCSSECAMLTDKCLVLCSPLMKRVFKLGFAENLVTVQCFTASKLAPEGQKVFVFLCHTPIGSLPFGVMLSETTKQVQQGIPMLLQMLKITSYSPKNIIIDVNTDLYEILKLLFPNSKIIFDEFQMLQLIWKVVRFVCEDQQEFQLLYNFFVVTLNSNSHEDYKRNFNKLQSYSVEYSKPDKLKYIRNFLNYFNEEANFYVSYCKPKAEISITNYTDSGTIILRDVAVKYSNQFNIVQLFDFLTKNYVTHYERKLKKVVDGDLKGFYKTNFYVPGSEMAEFTWEKINNTEFSVNFNQTKFFVNAELNTCTCQVGVRGGSCVHQFIVQTNVGLVPECYPLLGQDMLGIFKSILGYKDLNGLVDNCIDELQYLNDNKTSGELDFVAPEILDPPKNNKINILSTVIIKPALNVVQKIVEEQNDVMLEVTEIDSDTVDELASKVTVKNTDLVDRLSMACSRLSEFAGTKKFQHPIRKFLDKFQELASLSPDQLILALENFGQLEHHSGNRSSFSESHLELEELDKEDCEESAVTTPKRNRKHILTGIEELDQNVSQSHRLNDELSFLFNNPRFEAIVEDDLPSDQEEPTAVETHYSPVAISPLLTIPTDVVVTTLERESLKTAPEVVIKPPLRTRSQKPPQKTKNPKISRKKNRNSGLSSDSPLKVEQRNKRQSKVKKSKLELIVLLERNIDIELLCKAKKSGLLTNKKRRGYKELLESARKIKYPT